MNEQRIFAAIHTQYILLIVSIIYRRHCLHIGFLNILFSFSPSIRDGDGPAVSPANFIRGSILKNYINLK